MKKLLLTAAVAVSAMAVNAQALQPMEQMQKVQVQKSLKTKNVTAFISEKSKSPKKAVVDGCYYVRPVGSFAYGFDKEGMGYYSSYSIVAPYTEFELRNMSTKPGSQWLWVGDAEAAAPYVNENNNFQWSQDGATGYYMPTISTGKTEYTWGQTDNSYGDTYKSAMRCVEEVSPLSATDPHIGNDYIGWGYLSSHFLYGDGTVENDGNLYQCYAVAQDFDKPMSPLYVEDIFVSLLNFDSPTFLKAGEELTLDIINEAGEVLYTLTAGADDVTIDDRDPYDTQYGVMRFAQAIFTMKDIDPLTGDVAAVPFVLDEAFSVVISGFEGKNIGMRGHFCIDDDDNNTAEADVVSKGYNLFYNVADPNDNVSFTFQSHIAVPISFTAMFDKAQVWTSAFLNDGTELSDFNVLKISADGKTVENAGYPEANVAYVNTASGWFDADETEVYYLADAADEFPEWLAYGVDNSMWADPEAEKYGPTVYVGFEAEPLPAGVTGRGVKLYVNGRGIVSEEPIYILQGDYTKEMVDNEETGVNSVLAPKTFDGKTYNVAGQRVSNNNNGIVIKDGKKFINK